MDIEKLQKIIEKIEPPLSEIPKGEFSRRDMEGVGTGSGSTMLNKLTRRPDGVYPRVVFTKKYLIPNIMGNLSSIPYYKLLKSAKDE